jgi:hypothetical protein
MLRSVAEIRTDIKEVLARLSANRSQGEPEVDYSVLPALPLNTKSQLLSLEAQIEDESQKQILVRHKASHKCILLYERLRLTADQLIRRILYYQIN